MPFAFCPQEPPLTFAISGKICDVSVRLKCLDVPPAFSAADSSRPMPRRSPWLGGYSLRKNAAFKVIKVLFKNARAIYGFGKPRHYCVVEVY